MEKIYRDVAQSQVVASHHPQSGPHVQRDFVLIHQQQQHLVGLPIAGPNGVIDIVVVGVMACAAAKACWHNHKNAFLRFQEMSCQSNK